MNHEGTKGTKKEPKEGVYISSAGASHWLCLAVAGIRLMTGSLCIVQKCSSSWLCFVLFVYSWFVF